MSDLLSQDEIDALLNGTATDSEDDDSSASQEDQAQSESAKQEDKSDSTDEILSSEELDLIGEVGNISMGSAATTLSEVISRTVTITTPSVDVMDWQELMEQYPKPYVVTKVQFTEGILGTNLLIMKLEDVKVLTNLMTGEDPHTEREITDMELSAISEAMNQMVGSSCTAISSIVAKKIDITPPTSHKVDFSSEDVEDYNELSDNEKIVKASFKMVVEDLIDSEIMQILPVSFAKELAQSMFESQKAQSSADTQEQSPQQSDSTSKQDQTTPVNEQQAPQQNNQSQASGQQPPAQQQSQPPSQQPSQQSPRQQPVNGGQQNENIAAKSSTPKEPVNVQPAQFQSLEDNNYSEYKENIGLIMDVPLEVTVELGRASRMIRDILEFGPGSIVELDKLAGEPVDILVNGKAIAKGEVVVIDENFGVRITDIVHPSKRI